MAYNNTNEDSTLAYDLRQKYAEIVGIHLEAIAEARINKDFVKYYEGLDNLFTIVSHKFKTKKDYHDEGQEEKKTDEEYYRELEKEAIALCNKYPEVYLGNASPSEAEAVNLIDQAFKKMERFLYAIMDKAKMFGSGTFVEGL